MSLGTVKDGGATSGFIEDFALKQLYCGCNAGVSACERSRITI